MSRSSTAAGFRRLAAAAVGLTLVLVALGGAVRATGSGLACPDWPFCYGRLVPRQADIPPETGYTLWNVWLEHTHRLTASVVGFLILALAVWAVARFRHRPGLVASAVAALVLVTVQAGLGAAVVLRGLRAELVTAHLGMAMLVVALTVSLAVGGAREPTADRSLRRASVAVAGIAFVQILLGGHLTGTAAGLLYTSFPHLGEAQFVDPSVDQQITHVAHRLGAFVLLGGVGYLCARAGRGRERHGSPLVVKLPMWAATLVVVQVALGVANLWLATPPAVVTAHLAVASWIWTLLVLHALIVARTPTALAGPPVTEREGVRA